MSMWIFKIFNAVTNLVWCHCNGVWPWQGGNPLRENWTNGLIGRCFLHIRNLLELEQLKAWKVTVIWATFILGGQFFIHMQKFFLQSDYFVSHIHNSLCHFLMFSGVVSFPIAYCYNNILTIFFVLLLKISASDVLLSLYPLLNGSYTVSSDPHNLLCDPHDYADEF